MLRTNSTHEYEQLLHFKATLSNQPWFFIARFGYNLSVYIINHMKKTSGHSDGLKVRGFFRVQLTEDGKGVVGDSGWRENQVTNDGIRQYIVGWLVSGTGKSVTHMALGTGGAPAATDTTLSGELFHKSTNATTNSRAAVSTSVVASGTAQFTAQFSSANSFVTASADISNIGLFETYLTSLGNAGTLFAGNTYASSTCATNQSVNATYQIRFASA